MPCSSTPAGPPRQATAAFRCCLPPSQGRRLPRIVRFRGSITRPARSLSTLRGLGYPRTRARLASEWWPPFPGGDRAPRGFKRGFESFISSSSTRLGLAHCDPEQSPIFRQVSPRQLRRGKRRPPGDASRDACRGRHHRALGQTATSALWAEAPVWTPPPPRRIPTPALARSRRSSRVHTRFP